MNPVYWIQQPVRTTDLQSHCSESAVVLQNTLMIHRTHVNKELTRSDWIATPVRSHEQVMEYLGRLELLVNMNEGAHGLPFWKC